MSLIVNRREMSFLLNEVFDLSTVMSHERFQGIDATSVNEILDLAQSLAERLYLPCAASLDANEPRFVDGAAKVSSKVSDALRAYADAGFFAAGFDSAIGGMQLPTVVTMFVDAMFAAANVSILNYSLLTIANANVLNVFGSSSQKQRFLPPMLKGRWFGTMCLSEPQAGSSLADIRTRAEPASEGLYRIVGSKMWISGGDHDLSENIVHLVLARIPGGPPGVKGLSLFIVPKYRVSAGGDLGHSNNVFLVGLNHKMGQRGTTNCALSFGETGPCYGELVGEPHLGLTYMFHMMNEARVKIGANAVAAGLAGYLYSLHYARTRLQGRPLNNKDPGAPQTPIIEHPDVKRMLLAQRSAVEGGLALVSYCAMLLDQKLVSSDVGEQRQLSDLLDLLTPIAKSWPSEHCLEANKLAIQVLGGYGYARDYPLERHYRDNRLNPIHEGTVAIHGIDLLGRKVRASGGEPLRQLIERMNATVEAAKVRVELLDLSQNLQMAIAALGDATEKAVGCPDRDLGLANATLYLDAFGHIVIGWMWLKQAIVSAGALQAAGRSEQENCFYRGKLATARYFFRYELPKVYTSLALVSSLDDICVSMTSEYFAE